MADCHTPTVIQPSIPLADMTELEHLLLTYHFDSEPDGEALYFFSETGPRDCFDLPSEELREALAKSSGMDSAAGVYIAERLASIVGDAAEIEVDLSGTSCEFFLQDIVRRSRTLDHITIVSAFTCTKMRPDGFGGMAVLVTADAIKGKSTHDILEDFLAEFRSEAPDRAISAGGAPWAFLTKHETTSTRCSAPLPTAISH